MKKNNVRIQDFMVKYSDDNAKVNTLVSDSCHIIWLVATKDRSAYVIELCYSEDDEEEWFNKVLDGFDSKIIVCQSGPAVFEAAKIIQDGFDNDYDGFETISKMRKVEEV